MKYSTVFTFSMSVLVSRVLAVTSFDGTCGGVNAYTCNGSEFGNCCSAYGFCGSSTVHCGTGCQGTFGECTAVTGPEVSPDGTCGGTAGYTCEGSAFGNCCSAYGFCGGTSVHCGAGCQGTFGSGCTVVTGPPLSTDGTCGGANNYACHSEVGNCCSSSGWCGGTPAHCGTGCQSPFSVTGSCSVIIVNPNASVDGSCGANNGGRTCTGGAFDGQCCSVYGYCGASATHCSVAQGCQADFGATCT